MSTRERKRDINAEKNENMVCDDIIGFMNL